MSLEEYLEDQYHRDLQDLNTIEEVLRETAKLFEVTFDAKEFCWPYDLRAGAKTVVSKNSQGTSAMILAALGKMVWSHQGMSNWYKNSKGRVVMNSPWRLVDYRNMTEHLDPADYILSE